MNRWDFILLLGVALIAAGAGWYSPPLAPIILGIGAIAFSVIGAKAETHTVAQPPEEDTKP